MMAPAFEFVRQFEVWRGFIKYGRMIKMVDDFFFDNFFEIGKINDHPELNIIFVVDGNSNDRYRQFVTMSVDVLAFSVVTIQSVARFETEFFGDPDVTHGNQFDCKFSKLKP